jgi:hypothetical protein
MYPEIPHGSWFEDHGRGGPLATTAAECLARDKEWEGDCKINVEYKFTPASTPRALCQVKIAGVCAKYPTMPDGEWFDDHNGGGPIATTAAACLTRCDDWKASCKVNVEYQFNPA